MSTALPRRSRPAGLTVERLDLRRRAERNAFLDAGDSAARGVVGRRRPLRHDAHYLLDPSGSPLHAERPSACWVVRRGRRVVGRVAAYVDGAWDRLHGPGTGWFGFFACADDAGGCTLLLDRAARWLRAQGCARVRGPVNFHAEHGAGVRHRIRDGDAHGGGCEEDILMRVEAKYALALQFCRAFDDAGHG